MKKWIQFSLISLAGIIGIGQFWGVPMAVDTILNMSYDFEPHTIDMVLNDTDLVKNHYYIEGKKSPADYGFPEFEEVRFNTLNDTAIQLSGWMVHSAEADDAPVMLFVHGRGSNRLKPMKYLELFQSMGLASKYNMFFLDCRNSGHSSPASTQFGNKFAEDMTASILMLNEKYAVKDVDIYAFSMGATAAAIMLWREDLKSELNAQKVNIHKLIFDSPLSNVKALLNERGKEMSLPDFLLEKVTERMQADITDSKGNSVYDDMKFSVLLKDVSQPILFIHNEADKSTPFDMLQVELAELELSGRKNFTTQFFKNEVGAEEVHVRTFIHYREKYEEVVKDFLME